jgi:hypothetical protein
MMEKLVLMKRADSDAPDPWYEQFQKLITEKDSKMQKDSYSWMNPQESVDLGAEESNIAHRHLDKS